MPTCLSISAIFLTMVSSTSGDDTFFSVATTTPFVAVAATRTNRRSRQQRGACTSPSRVGAGPDEIPSARWRSQHARHAPHTVHAARNFEKRRCTMARDKQAEEARHAEPHEAPPRTRPQRACGGVCRPAPLAPAVGPPLRATAFARKEPGGTFDAERSAARVHCVECILDLDELA